MCLNLKIGIFGAYKFEKKYDISICKVFGILIICISSFIEFETANVNAIMCSM